VLLVVVDSGFVALCTHSFLVHTQRKVAKMHLLAFVCLHVTTWDLLNRSS
jgi:hypothetical protein